MSCWGSRTTPLVQFHLDHEIAYDDSWGNTRAFTPHIDLFIRVWKWEFTASLWRIPTKTFRFHRDARCVWVPLLGRIDWGGIESFPAHQYSNDYDERVDEIRRNAR